MPISEANVITYRSPTFTPAQAAFLTGVSPDLQRDWRRRGLLASKPVEKHTRFEVGDLCRMIALKAFSNAGLQLKDTNIGDFRDAQSASGVAVLPMMKFAGQRVGTTSPDHQLERYVIVDGDGTCRTGDLDAYAKRREAKPPKDPVVVIFDCLVAGEDLRLKLHELQALQANTDEGEDA